MMSLYRKEYIVGIENFDSAAGLSSIDLHLSGESYRMKHGSIKPCGDKYLDILTNSKHAELLKPDTNKHFKLKAKECYVFKLKESFTPHFLDNKIILFLSRKLWTVFSAQAKT